VRRKKHTKNAWFGADHYARQALGMDMRSGSHMVDSQIHIATRAFSSHVVTNLSPSSFKVTGDKPEAVAVATKAFLSDHSNIWSAPNINMAIAQYVDALIRYGTFYLLLEFEPDESDPQLTLLTDLAYIGAETIQRHVRSGKLTYEQLVTKTSTYSEVLWNEFPADEILELTWPLPIENGSKSPYIEAYKLGLPEDRLTEQSLLGGAAQNKPEDTFLTYAFARFGRYNDSFNAYRRLNAAVGDKLFYVPDDPTTQYFLLERFIRRMNAIAHARSYIIDQLNVALARWSDKNNWGRLEIAFDIPLLTEQDWNDVWDSYTDKSLTYDDVIALINSDVSGKN